MCVEGVNLTYLQFRIVRSGKRYLQLVGFTARHIVKFESYLPCSILVCIIIYLPAYVKKLVRLKQVFHLNPCLGKFSVITKAQCQNQ